MKKIFIVFIFIISMFFVSCSNDNRIAKSWRECIDEPQIFPCIYMTGEITSKLKIKIGSEFEVKVGIAKFKCLPKDCSTAFFLICAKDFIITDQNGNEFQDVYYFKYYDFTDEKYMGTLNNVNYYETFKFKYIGDTDYKISWISFRIWTDNLNYENNYPYSASIDIYYEVDNNKINISAYRFSDKRSQITFKQYLKNILYYFIWFNVITFIPFVIIFIFIIIKKKKNKIIDNDQQNNNDKLIE